MKARGCLIVAAWAVVLVLAPGASAYTNLHPRHVEYRPPSVRGFVFLGDQDGYELGIALEEPDVAVLSVGILDEETQARALTDYGAHFTGSLRGGGRIRARFGTIGSISLHFVADGQTHPHRLPKNCQGEATRDEGGHFVGRIALRGEGDYFRVASTRVAGDLTRSFRLRCHVKHRAPVYPPPSLRTAVAPSFEFSTTGGGGGSLSMLEATDREGRRALALTAGHQEGSPPGAEVEAGTFEYQGAMPVGRFADAPQSAAGTLVTSLPGEHPPTATLKPDAPFSGEGTYTAISPTSHSWTGDIAVQFPGLLQPLAGQGFYSSLCVVSALRVRYGCDFLPPDLQVAE